jgi:hypothetical protein
MREKRPFTNRHGIAPDQLDIDQRAGMRPVKHLQSAENALEQDNADGEHGAPFEWRLNGKAAAAPPVQGVNRPATETELAAAARRP